MRIARYRRIPDIKGGFVGERDAMTSPGRRSPVTSTGSLPRPSPPVPSRLSLSIGATLSILNLETETALNSGETHVQGNIDMPPVIWSVYDTTRGNGVGGEQRLSSMVET